MCSYEEVAGGQCTNYCTPFQTATLTLSLSAYGWCAAQPEESMTCSACFLFQGDLVVLQLWTPMEAGGLQNYLLWREFVMPVLVLARCNCMDRGFLKICDYIPISFNLSLMLITNSADEWKHKGVSEATNPGSSSASLQAHCSEGHRSRKSGRIRHFSVLEEYFRPLPNFHVWVRCVHLMHRPVLLLRPMYRLLHPEKHLFLLWDIF